MESTNQVMGKLSCLLFCIIALSLFSACVPLQNTLNPYEENFKCRAKDDEGISNLALNWCWACCFPFCIVFKLA